MPGRPSTAKNFCFTWNNPPGIDDFTPEQIWEAFQTQGASFLVFQLEKGQSGTPHYQGYLELCRPKRFTQLTAVIPGLPHWEVRKGTPDEAAAYCRKEEGRQSGPYEFGTIRPSVQGKRSDIDAFVSAVRSDDKLSMRELLGEHAGILARYLKFTDRLRAVTMPKLRDTPPRVHILCGEPGVGKTRFVYDAIKDDPDDFYRLPVGSGLWFDGYDGQANVLLDEFAGRMNKVELAFLLQLLDRYPVSAPVKGAFVWWYPKVIYITTNYRPCDWYDWTNRLTSFQALKRRITHVSIYKDGHVCHFRGNDCFDCPPDLPNSQLLSLYKWFWTEPQPVRG
jgi:hypothetical protein